MPIRINLLAEDQAAEEMRRKDPVKRAIWYGGFLVALVLLWALSIFLQSIFARMELSSLETRWKLMEKQVKQVEADRRLTAEVGQKLSALSQFTTNRFLWANALNALQQASVPNVQIIRLKAEQYYLQGDAPKPAPAAALAPGSAPAAKAPALAVEKIVLRLDGRDFSPRVGEQIPRLKEMLAGTPFFQAGLQKTNSILLTSLSAPQTETQSKGTYVVFGLQLNFQDKERRLYE